MKEIKTYPRYKCDFCKKKAVLYAMTRHEKQCYLNKDRYCNTCKNTGTAETEEDRGEYTETIRVPCWDCFKAKEALALVETLKNL